MEGVSRTGLVLRLSFFFFLEIIGLKFFATVLHGLFGYLAAAALGTFFAAAAANAIVVRIWERGRLEDVGMGWHGDAWRHRSLGAAAGAAAAAFVLGLPLLTGMARLVPATDPAAAFGLTKLLYITFILLFGAIGEEMLFRGYGFQVLMGVFGPWPIVIASGLIFAFAHSANINVSWLGLVNTGLWGVLLGYAFVRSGDLWLPIGLHFGWNWMLPVFGVNLSGYTMGVSGFVLDWSAGTLWSGGGYGPEASLITSLAVPLAAFWLYRLNLRTQPAFLVEAHRRRPDHAENIA